MPQTGSLTLEGQKTGLEKEEEVLPSLETLEEQKAKLGATLDSIIAECTVTNKSDHTGDEFFAQQLMTGEQLEKHERVAANYMAVCEAIKRRLSLNKADDVEKERVEFIDSAADRTKFKQLDVDFKFHQTLMDIGANKYSNDKVLEQGGRDELELPIPVITKDANGHNKVLPIEAAFGNSEEAIKQSYMIAEIIHAGKQDKYSTEGQLLENIDASYISAAVSSNPVRTTDVSMPTMVMRMYAYLIDMKEIFKYCTIEQTPTLAPIVRDRRTDIPTVDQIDEGAQYKKSQPGYDNVWLPVFKYGKIMQFTLESTMSGAGFDIANDIVEVCGIALSNGFGTVTTTGTGEGVKADTQPQGIITGASVGAVLKYNEAFAAAGATFTYNHLLKYLTSLNDAYWKTISKRFVYPLMMEQYIKGMLDANKRPYFQYNSPTLFPGISILIDPGMPKLSMTAGDYTTKVGGWAAGETTMYPILYGDLAKHMIRFAGSPRLSFSDEYGYDRDLLSYKVTGFCGSATLDANALKKHGFNTTGT